MSDSVSKYYENQESEIKQYEFTPEGSLMGTEMLEYLNGELNDLVEKLNTQVEQLEQENKELKVRNQELEIASFQDLGR